MNGKTGSAQNLEETIHQLQASGVLFCLEYVGSVVVEKSINSLSAEKQAEVARVCMSSVVAKAMPSMNLPNHEEEMSSTYVRGPIQSHCLDVEMNISSSAIIIIDGNPLRPLHRFKIQDVSLLSPGFDELSSFFCFFAKVQVPGQQQQQQQQQSNQWLRKCFVFNARSEMEDVRDVICFAFRLNEHNNTSARRDSEASIKEGGNREEDAATPVPPAAPVLMETPSLPNCPSSSSGSTANVVPAQIPAAIPEIRIAGKEKEGGGQKVPPEVPPRPRRYTSGNGGMERMKGGGGDQNGGGGGNNSTNSLLPGLRQGRSGTMGGTSPIGGSSSSGGMEGRSNSISPRTADISVQISPDRYKELTRDLNAQNWFHGILPRLKADALIRLNGQFLVRQSPNIADQFVLVGMHDDKVRHVCLVSKDGKIQTTIGEFKNIVDLIKYFHHSRSPLMLHGEQLQLHLPINRQQPLPPTTQQ